MYNFIRLSGNLEGMVSIRAQPSSIFFWDPVFKTKSQYVHLTLDKWFFPAIG